MEETDFSVEHIAKAQTAESINYKHENFNEKKLKIQQLMQQNDLNDALNPQNLNQNRVNNVVKKSNKVINNIPSDNIRETNT